MTDKDKKYEGDSLLGFLVFGDFLDVGSECEITIGKTTLEEFEECLKAVYNADYRAEYKRRFHEDIEDFDRATLQLLYDRLNSNIEHGKVICAQKVKQRYTDYSLDYAMSSDSIPTYQIVARDEANNACVVCSFIKSQEFAYDGFDYEAYWQEKKEENNDD